MISSIQSMPLEARGLSSHGPKRTTQGNRTVINAGYMGTLYHPGERGIFSVTDAQDRYVTVAYTEDSQENDPVVLIKWGQTNKGEHFEKTVHIKDIDPRNATYPEMCALTAHESKNGHANPADPFGGPLPPVETAPAYSQRLDFTKLLESCIQRHQRYNPGMAFRAQSVLEICRQQIEQLEKRQNDKIESIKQDALMKLLESAGCTRVESQQPVPSSAVGDQIASLL